MRVRNFLRRNGDIVALAGGLTGLMLPLTGMVAYLSRRYADLYAQYQQYPQLLEKSEMYESMIPVLGLVYLLGMGPLVCSAIERRKHNNSSQHHR